MPSDESKSLSHSDPATNLLEEPKNNDAKKDIELQKPDQANGDGPLN